MQNFKLMSEIAVLMKIVNFISLSNGTNNHDTNNNNINYNNNNKNN